MYFSANGFFENTLTMKASASMEVGTPVKLTDSFTVAPCENGDAVQGVVRTCREGTCAVQLTGAVTMPFTGSAPTVGFGILTANGTGGVKTGTEGKSSLILAVDSVKSTVTYML